MPLQGWGQRSLCSPPGTRLCPPQPAPLLSSLSKWETCEWMAKPFPTRNWGSWAACMKKRVSVPQFSWPTGAFKLPWHQWEKKKKLSEKNLLHLCCWALQKFGTERIWKSLPEFSRKLNPTCSFQCRKWDREVLCWKILNSVLIYLYWEPRLSIQPVYSLRAAKTAAIFKDQRRFQSLVYPNCMGTIRY